VEHAGTNGRDEILLKICAEKTIPTLVLSRSGNKGLPVGISGFTPPLGLLRTS